jgi:hypothetical protein
VLLDNKAIYNKVMEAQGKFVKVFNKKRMENAEKGLQEGVGGGHQQ